MNVSRGICKQNSIFNLQCFVDYKEDERFYAMCNLEVAANANVFRAVSEIGFPAWRVIDISDHKAVYTRLINFLKIRAKQILPEEHVEQTFRNINTTEEFVDKIFYVAGLVLGSVKDEDASDIV